MTPPAACDDDRDSSAEGAEPHRWQLYPRDGAATAHRPETERTAERYFGREVIAPQGKRAESVALGVAFKVLHASPTSSRVLGFFRRQPSSGGPGFALGYAF